MLGFHQLGLQRFPIFPVKSEKWEQQVEASPTLSFWSSHARIQGFNLSLFLFLGLEGFSIHVLPPLCLFPEGQVVRDRVQSLSGCSLGRTLFWVKFWHHLKGCTQRGPRTWISDCKGGTCIQEQPPPTYNSWRKLGDHTSCNNAEIAAQFSKAEAIFSLCWPKVMLSSGRYLSSDLILVFPSPHHSPRYHKFCPSLIALPFPLSSQHLVFHWVTKWLKITILILQSVSEWLFFFWIMHPGCWSHLCHLHFPSQLTHLSKAAPHETTKASLEPQHRQKRAPNPQEKQICFYSGSIPEEGPRVKCPVLPEGGFPKKQGRFLRSPCNAWAPAHHMLLNTLNPDCLHSSFTAAKDPNPNCRTETRRLKCDPAPACVFISPVFGSTGSSCKSSIVHCLCATGILSFVEVQAALFRC